MNVRVGGYSHVHKRVRGGNTACGLSKGKHNIFPASGKVTCPCCQTRPLIKGGEPRKALVIARKLPPSKGNIDHITALSEAMYAVMQANA
jgi:hypothetical protein